jgi:hypothetical protein
VDFVIAQGIAFEFKESIASALGMSYGGKIALLPGHLPLRDSGLNSLYPGKSASVAWSFPEVGPADSRYAPRCTEPGQSVGHA